MRHKLRGSVDTFLPVFNKDWYFVRSSRFEYLGQLCNSLFKDLRWAYIDFGDDDHDRNFEGKRNTEVLFAHADKAVIRRYHEETVIGLAGEKTKNLEDVNVIQLGSSLYDLKRLTVVRRYFSCPAKSVKLITFADRRPISSQVSLRPATVETTTSPLLSKPIILSKPISKLHPRGNSSRLLQKGRRCLRTPCQPS